MNWQQVKTNWNDVREQVHSKWNRLTDADLKAIGGKREELIKRIQKRYSLDSSAAEQQAESFLKTLH